MTGAPCPRRRRTRVHRRRAREAIVLAFAAVLFGLATNTAPSISAEPTPSATTSPSAAVPTPTKHSYDDKHSEQQPEGASPALWILGGALIGLIAIAVILLRAGKTERHHLARNP